MNCPVCAASLRPVVRHGVEIDTCPQCRGVWLDRGELELLIAWEARRDDDDSGEYPAHNSYPNRPHHGHPGVDPQYRPPKRKSFWSNLFDD